MATKTLFQLNQELETLKTDYHDNADNRTRVEDEALSAKIVDLNSQISAAIVGNIKTDEGQTIQGMKVRRGEYEIGDGTNRSRGETPEEAQYNWDAGNFYIPDPEASPVGKAVEAPPEVVAVESEVPVGEPA